MSAETKVENPGTVSRYDLNLKYQVESKEKELQES